MDVQSFMKRLYKGALDQSNEQYHSDTKRVSKSGLDQLARSAAHYYAKYLDPDKWSVTGGRWERTEAMRIGSAIHASVFEPHTFETDYIAIPKDAPRRPTAAQYGAKNASDQTIKDIVYWQMFDTKNAGREQLRGEDMTLCLRARDRVYKHPGARVLLEKGGYAENTFHFTEPNTKVKCKLRPDYIHADRFIIDLKSCEDARRSAFERSIMRYRYDVQDAFYMDGFKLATGEDAEGFIFIAIEKENPLNVQLYHLDAEDRDNARRVYIENLQRYKDAVKAKTWEGYAPTIEKIKLQYARL